MAAWAGCDRFWSVAAMVIGSPNARVNRFLRSSKNPHEMGTSRILPLRRGKARLRRIHPDA
jgi:hypothetical protein